MKHNLCSSLLLATAAVTVLSGSAPGIPSNASFRLETLWRVSTETQARPGTIYRLATCGDGSSYFVESNGRVLQLGPDGQMTADVKDAEAVDTVAAACDSRGRLVVSTGREIATQSPAGTNLIALGRATAPVTSIALTDDSILGLGHDEANRPAILRFSNPPRQDGEPSVLTLLTGVSNVQQLSMGHIVRDRDRSRVGVVLGGSYQLQEFDLNGAILGLKLRSDPEFRFLQTPRLFAPPIPSDQVRFFHHLPRGRHIAVVVKHEEISAAHMRSRTSVEILDASLDLVGVVGNGAELGIPQGVSADGDIFLSGVTPRGSWVTRTRLRQDH